MASLEEYRDKSEWVAKFESLRPDLYFPESWSAETRATVIEEIRPNKTRTAMFASIPMICKADKCVFAQTCPLQQKGMAPKSLPCPYEQSMTHQFMVEYMEELAVHPGNLIEVSMVRDLVDQEIQYLRKTKILAQEHFIQENVVGMDSEGRPVMKKELHMAVELEDRLHRRKKELRNQLLATRESRAKVGQSHQDTAQTISRLLENVAKVERENKRAIQQVQGLLPVDEYIEGEEVLEDEPTKEA